MKVNQFGNIRYLTFDSLILAGVVHGIFTRMGGVSPHPWKSLNVGASVGDDLDRVRQNRQRIFDALNRKTSSVFDVWQVHSNRVIITNAARSSDIPIEKADGILTNKADITLFMRFADCVPILLFDPQIKVFGIIHAGWIGTVEKIIREAIHMMKVNFNSKPIDILACIGPSIGPDHYEVRNDVVEKVHTAFSGDSTNILLNRDGKIFLDLWKASEYLLRNEGVENIELASICTVCNNQDWYSHRGEFGKTGRFGVLIGL